MAKTFSVQFDGPTADSVRFFKKHSGHVNDDGVGLQLARAEVIAKEFGWTFEWQEEEEDWESFLGDGMTLDDVNEILYVVLRDRHGNALASLGGIIDPDKVFGRVTEAELADEELFEMGIDTSR